MVFKTAKTGEMYYPDPLPNWLEDFGSSGQRLVRLYHSFVKEWSTVLSYHPESILRCQPCVLDEVHFPCLDESVEVDRTVALLLPRWSFSLGNNSSLKPLQIHLVQSDNAIIAVIRSFKIDSGVLKVLQARADIGIKTDALQTAIPTSDFVLPLKNIFISAEDRDVYGDHPTDRYPTAIEKNIPILRILSSAQQITNWLSNAASSLEQQLARKHPNCDTMQTEMGSVQNDSITVISQRSVVVHRCEDSTSETSDSSDEEESKPSVYYNQICMVENMLCAFVGDEMKTFAHSTQPGRLQRSEPKICPQGKRVIWALNEREVLLWDVESGKQVIQDLPSTKQVLQKNIWFLIGMLCL